jgi:hypothetical protein
MILNLFSSVSTAGISGPLQIDTLLKRFAEKDLQYRVTANPFRGSILWKMEVPQIGQVLLIGHNDSCHIVMHTSYVYV